MAVYNVHAGHNTIVPGAAKYLNEVTEDRKVKDKVIAYLRAAGHTVYDCTDNTGRTKGVNLANIVAKCNKHSVALDISIHLNAGGGTGVEVWNYDSRTKAISDRICKNVSSALGIKNRGTKYNKAFYVLNSTKSLALLVECCFVDSATDKAKWNVDKCAKAIAEGILGKSITTSTASPANTSSGMTYYKKYTGSSGQVDVVFKAIGVPASYTGSWSKRKPVASKNGISGYTGTAAQNTKLITLAKQGKLKKA